jgi:phenylacetate-CoA ligase
LEILKNDGLPAGQGEIGEMVITDLDNYGFPFIRYKIGDMAVPSEKICSCGRGLPLLEKLQGRSFDIVTAPKGNRIAGTFWTLALRSVPGVNNFQVEQILLDKLTVRIVPGKDYSQASEKKIIELIQEKCGREMDINITCVDEIPLTKSGKLRFVISRIENE